MSNCLENQFIYKYGLIDAQYILMRNKNMLAGQYYPNPVPKDKLLTVTLQSFMKLKRDMRFKYPLLLWDKSPYYKSLLITEYKKDRYIPTEDEVVELNKKLDECKDEAEREKIKDKIHKINIDMENFDTMQSIKYGFLDEVFRDSGFISVLKGGYEADDLAYVFARCISEKYTNGDKDSTAILLTADKDWLNFQLPGVVFISTYNGSNYPDLYKDYIDFANQVNSASVKLFGESVALTRYQYGILTELLGYSHNNAGIWTHSDLDMYEVVARILHGDTTLPDYELVNSCYKAMNMDIGNIPVIEDGNISYDKSYRDDLVKLTKFMLSDESKLFSCKNSVFPDYCRKNYLNINMDSYNKFIDGFEVSLW